MIHIFHKWSKWETIEQGRIYVEGKPVLPNHSIGFYKLQQRICKKCNKIQLRTVETF